jgi:hypothetical protein
MAGDAMGLVTQVPADRGHLPPRIGSDWPAPRMRVIALLRGRAVWIVMFGTAAPRSRGPVRRALQLQRI